LRRAASEGRSVGSTIERILHAHMVQEEAAE
jgi:hypothetical protein